MDPSRRSSWNEFAEDVLAADIVPVRAAGVLLDRGDQMLT